MERLFDKAGNGGGATPLKVEPEDRQADAADVDDATTVTPAPVDEPPADHGNGEAPAKPAAPTAAPAIVRGPSRLVRFSQWLRPRFAYLVPLLFLAAALLFRVESPPFIQLFQLKLFDLYQQIRPRPYESVPVKYIDVDDASLAKMGQWPWPRNQLADMLIRLFEAGASVVAFDAVFAERDRTSPAQVLPVWLNVATIDSAELPEEWRQFSKAILDSVPDHDDLFAEVLSQTNSVGGFVLTNDTGGRAPEPKAGIAHAGDDPRQFLPPFDGVVPNLEAIDKAVSGLGSINMVPDADSVVRRIPMLMRHGEQIYGSLSLEALRVAQGARSYILKSSGANMEASYGQATGLNHIKVGNYEIPVDGAGNMWIHYTRETRQRILPAYKVFEEDFDPALVKDHILFVGTSAAGLKDLRTTPLNPAAPGVEVHVQAIEQILLGKYLHRPDWADGVEIVFILALGLVLVGLTPRVGALGGAAVSATAIIVAISLSWWLYREQRMLLDPLYPAIATLFVYLSGSLLSYLNAEAEKRQVRGAFSQYLSPALVEQLASDPARLRLGGEMKEMTFLFCDVRGFTSISERFKSDPQGLTRLINDFLTPMTDAILARNGTIDKYMGDCIMAFWNAPLDDPRHADHGCESAMAMFEELEALNQRFADEAEMLGTEPMSLNVGIGLNTGECVVGNMGSEQRFDYSVLGDAVNLASRLEGQSKNYGIGTVIGEQTHLAASDYPAIELDLIAVKGKAEAARIYGLMGNPEMKDDPALQGLLARHDQMLSAYRSQDWDAASRLVADCRGLDGQLGVLYDLYDERIAFYRDNPPGSDWDGVFVADTK